MSISRMESIRGFLVYVSITYRYMNSYLEGVNLMLDSWSSYMDEEGWRLRVEEINMVKVEGEW